MTLKPGTRLWSTVSTVSVVVVRPPSAESAESGEVELTCGDAAMVEYEPGDVTDDGVAGANGAGAVIGKRYTDERTGMQVLCTRPGAGVLAVGGRPMTMMSARPLPASD